MKRLALSFVLLVTVVPIALAGVRTVGNARRLGSRSDPVATQQALAVSILRDHLVCFALIGTALVVQLTWAAR